MKIIRSTEAIEVPHPIFLLFGQPGICKTSLGYSMPDPLLLDFDKGSHRATNRRDTLQIDDWSDAIELADSVHGLDAYRAVSVDTVGRALDVLTAHILKTDPKKGSAGNLNQQGWGRLKADFRGWLNAVRAKGVDVLLIAHDKEDKDGDTRIVRPDVVGGSYGEVMKNADFVGYCYMSGRDRVLDFSPTDRWVGKNPAGWEPFKVPPPHKAQAFMADLYARGREALGQISEASAKVAQDVEAWRTRIAGLDGPEAYNALIPEIKKLPAILQPQVAKILVDVGKSAGFTVNPKTKKFEAFEAAAVLA